MMVGVVAGMALAEGRRHDDPTDGDIATATDHRTPPWSVIVQQAAISQRDTDATHVSVCYPTWRKSELWKWQAAVYLPSPLTYPYW